MTYKRGFTKDRRAVSVLSDAIKTGSLERSDTDGAAEILAKTLPDTARLPQAVRKILATNAIRTIRLSGKSLTDLGNDKFPRSSLPSSAQISKPAPFSAELTNSNDLLPSARRMFPINTGLDARKRRRVISALSKGSDRHELSKSVSFLSSRPRERFDDVGGISSILDTIRELVVWPLANRNIYEHLGISPPTGILLHGPPGCGKTLLAHAIGGELGVSFLKADGPEIVSCVSGESERKLRDIFEEAVRVQPSIVFIDQVDALAPKRDGANMQRRILPQLLSCVDNLLSSNSSVIPDAAEKNAKTFPEPADSFSSEKTDEVAKPTKPGKQASVIVIAATNRPESLEPALRRAGRFDREIEIGAPDEKARAAILAKLCRKMKIDSDVDFLTLAKRTAGYVGADLNLLTKEAGLARIRSFAERSPNSFSLKGKEGEIEVARNPQNFGGVCITMDNFVQALRTVQPSALREGFANRPSVSWKNIGSLEDVREEMMMAIVEPIRRPELFSSLGLRAPAGVLLYGPPGCGKTLLAKAVAAESGANFISVKGPELLSKYVGDSEMAVRRVFSRARSCSPCIIFFDELDALAPRRRGSGSSDSSGVSERVVNMLLTEMDGFSARKEVFLIAATNRPDIIDRAILRPGRLDKLVHVPLPDTRGRASILRALLREVKVANDVDADKISMNSASSGYSGADLQALIRSAGEKALRERMLSPENPNEIRIQQRHFDHALKIVLPSVSRSDAQQYLKLEMGLR